MALASNSIRKSSSYRANGGTLNKAVYHKYLDMNQKGKVIATYVWIDGTGEGLRAKAKVVDKRPTGVKELSEWSFDGSSTYQAQGHNSDVVMNPVAMYPDPFFGGDNILVLCDTYDFKGNPLPTNNRKSCNEAMEKVKKLKPLFGFEQEYTLYDSDGKALGWPKDGQPAPQGPYYCGVGAGRVFGREVNEAHLKACLHAGLGISGINAEVMPAQWEYQIGPVHGIDCSDQMWISRYMLYRIAEEFGVVVTLHPKPEPNPWNGAGCHANFSTIETLAKGTGIEKLHEAVALLGKRHMEHIVRYDPHGGEDNKLRLSGQCEAPTMDKFTWGIGDRGASIRLHRRVVEDGCGYLEDRRPASNCDPYSVSDMIVRTVLLKE